jgi:S-DNA-T family DNA segregation ATPase FtsK/SpoIIIE
VVSPEIRANCSLRICLRTTDESDARDVLGSTLAAQLSPDRPGRAYLRTGSAPPALFQVARVSATGATTEPVVRARRWVWPPASGAPRERPVPSRAATDLQRVVAALAARAASDGLQPADRPWLAALPDRLEVADLDRWSAGARPSRLLIGLQDLPDAQRQVPLELDLAEGGGWLFVGGPRSGRTTALCTVLTEAVRRLTPEQLHVHVLDHGGGAVARQAAALPHCGTAVDRADAHRSMRLIARLADEVDRRRGGAARPDEPVLLVLVDGYESLVAQLEDADPATGAAGLLRLVRDGAAVGVTVALTGDRAVPGSRVAAAVRTRLVLPLPDRADYAVAGVAARAVPGHRPAGRALVGEDAVECQLALPGPLPALGPAHTGLRPDDDHPPIRVVALPADPVLPLPVTGASGAGGPDGLWLPLGPGGDEGRPVGVDLRRAGGLLVVGPPGSGRSAALQAFGRHCAQAGAAVLDLSTVHAEGLREWTGRLSPARPAVVVADDLARVPDAVADLLGPTGSVGAPLLLIASGTAADLAGTFRGPAVALRRSRTALVLRPAAGDAELLGLRTPRSPLPARPGAGWLVTPTEATRVQVARHRTATASGRDRPPAGAGDQRRSSAGPISCVAYQASS